MRRLFSLVSMVAGMLAVMLALTAGAAFAKLNDPPGAPLMAGGQGSGGGGSGGGNASLLTQQNDDTIIYNFGQGFGGGGEGGGGGLHTTLDNADDSGTGDFSLSVSGGGAGFFAGHCDITGNYTTQQGSQTCQGKGLRGPTTVEITPPPPDEEGL